jgi:hypothetical protein
VTSRQDDIVRTTRGSKIRKIYSIMFSPFEPTQCGAAAKTSRLITPLSEDKGERNNDKVRVPLNLASPHFGSKKGTRAKLLEISALTVPVRCSGKMTATLNSGDLSQIARKLLSNFGSLQGLTLNKLAVVLADV